MSQNQFSATELQTYANVQIAAETLYGLLNGHLGDTTNIDQTNFLTGTHWGQTSIELLREGNKHSSLFSETQAKEFVENWEIVSHLPNTATGFSGTLFRVKAENGIPNTTLKQGDLVISFRSTEFVEDQLRDSIATNTLEITKTGWAMGQISDMEDWFASLKREGLVGKDQKINVTGYSLGGHLATAFHILHSEQIEKTFTFNGAGVGSIGGDEITTKEELRKVIDTFNIYRNSNNQKLDYFYQENANSDENYKAVNDLANSISENLNKILGKMDTSDNIMLDYIDELKVSKSRVVQQRVEFIKQAVVPKEYILKLEQIDTALDRLLEIANEYKRISDIIFPDGNYPASPLVGEVDALRFNYQMGVLIAAEKTNTHKLDNIENVTWSNDLDIVDSSPNIYNIKAGTYPSMTAVSQLHYGKEIDIAIEDQPLYRGDERWNIIKGTSWKEFGLRIKLYADNETSAFGDTHSLVLIVDSLSVHSLFEKLDTSFTDKEFKKIFALGTNLKKQTIANEQGYAEGDALENIVNSLAKMLGVAIDDNDKDKELKGNPNGNTWHIMSYDNTPNPEGYTGREDLHKAIAQIAQAIEDNQLQGKFTVHNCMQTNVNTVLWEHYTINSLRDGFDAKNNFADFLAIYTLSPFSLIAKDKTALEEYWKGNDKIAEIYEQWQKDKDAVANK
ncbi:MAG: hypothetical protein J6W29_05175, partial [Neisseriaceae bacterium]|nr:hypothetical protein [Neisseriaceae bacterium]